MEKKAVPTNRGTGISGGEAPSRRRAGSFARYYGAMRWAAAVVWVGVMVLSTGQAAAPPGTPPRLWVRLLTPVGSRRSAPGTVVEGVVIQAYSQTGGGFLGAGTRLSGKVQAVSTKGSGSLRFAFDTVLTGERRVAVKTRITEVDNARENVGADGTITGLDLLRKRPGKTELILLAAAHAHPEALALIEGTKLALREFRRADIEYPAGTDVALAVEGLSAETAPGSAAPEAGVGPGALAEILNGLPQRTTSKDPAMPSDRVNVAFVGSREKLTQAFAAAGWQTAEALSVRSDVRVFFAVAEHHAYRSAPVSTLLLAGREPDLVFQKQNNTFAKRHHIRIWATGRTWDGQAVWAGAATHDIGIDFSARTKTFTHRIEADVDVERAKVVTDLSFAESVRSVNFLERPGAAGEARNATGDPFHTDGRLAVVALR